uniref:Uncharacterized protein n=1 Tax=Schistosoma japonicum TaxID=6182 RepID=Q5BYE2_SCHJA|nr:unknown [Schistosoma japonicum]
MISLASTAEYILTFNQTTFSFSLKSCAKSMPFHKANSFSKQPIIA